MRVLKRSKKPEFRSWHYSRIWICHERAILNSGILAPGFMLLVSNSMKQLLTRLRRTHGADLLMAYG
jgi:hypothetical protein